MAGGPLLATLVGHMPWIDPTIARKRKAAAAPICQHTHRPYKRLHTTADDARTQPQTHRPRHILVVVVEMQVLARRSATPGRENIFGAKCRAAHERIVIMMVNRYE